SAVSRPRPSPRSPSCRRIYPMGVCAPLRQVRSSGGELDIGRPMRHGRLGSDNSGGSAPVRTSAKAAQFTESVIRETFRLAAQHGAINLGQGFPDFPCPPELKAAACAAIAADDNQYPMTYGTPALRAAIAEKTARTYPGWT